MELEIRMSHILRIWWAYFWRNLIAIVASGIISALVGAVLGIILSRSGIDFEAARPYFTVLGLAIGLAVSIVPVALILGKDFGDFRLVLVTSAPSRSDSAVQA